MSKKVVYRAGVIPYFVENGEIKMLFMKPSKEKFGGNKFQIAKGKQEEGESDETTAFREAGEELGLFLGNVVQKKDLGTFLGRTRIFVAEIKDVDMFGDPCSETAEIKWMSLPEFKDSGRDIHKPIIKAAIRSIKKTHKLD